MQGSKGLQFAFSATEQLLFTYSVGQLARSGISYHNELFLVGTSDNPIPIITDTQEAINNIEKPHCALYDLKKLDMSKIKDHVKKQGLYLEKGSEITINSSLNDANVKLRLQPQPQQQSKIKLSR